MMKLCGMLPAGSLAVALLLALSGCGGIDIPMRPAIPAAESGEPDPTVSESVTQADAVMTCDSIATERAGIAQSLAGLDDQAAATRLRQREATLARLAALKRCGPS